MGKSKSLVLDKARNIKKHFERPGTDIIRKLEEVFAMDGTIAEACYYAGITRQTYYNWTKEMPEMLERFEDLRNRPILLARQTVVRAIKDNPEYAFKYLERKMRKEFGNQVEVNNNLTLTRIEKIEMIQPHEQNYIEANAETIPSLDTPDEH